MLHRNYGKMAIYTINKAFILYYKPLVWLISVFDLKALESVGDSW